MTDKFPFSNGTEERAWQEVWCEHCVHDHGMHPGGAEDGGCDLFMHYLLGTADPGEWRWPEAWTPEPPGFTHHCPSLMLCGQFKPCTTGGCEGDPHADTRAEVTVHVRNAWDVYRKAATS